MSIVVPNELLAYTVDSLNLNFQVWIASAVNKRIVKSWISSDFRFTLASNSSEAIDYSILTKINQFTKLAGYFGESNDLPEWITSGLKSLSKKRLFNKKLSTLFWNYSSRLSFSLPLIFIAMDENDDITKHIQALAQTVLPTEDKISFTEPAGFGTVSVQIGTWFKARNMIIDSIDPIFSKEVLAKNGKPAYATCDVKFSSKFIMTYADFLNCFVMDAK
jgi:hypothetical protein